MGKAGRLVLYISIEFFMVKWTTLAQKVYPLYQVDKSEGFHNE